MIPYVFTRIICCVIVASALFSYLYFDMWFKAYDRYEGESTVVGTVEEIKDGSYNTILYVKASDINGTALSNYRLVVYVDAYDAYKCTVGSEVTVCGSISRFTSGEDFDSESYYTSKGYSGVINSPSSFSYENSGSKPLSYWISQLRGAISSLMIDSSDDRSGGLLAALVMGEREHLPLGTKLDFSRIGISHVLALSGMHLAILVIGLSRLLSFIGVGKKTATVISILFTVAYMALTGFSVSVTRAGVMLICSSLLYLLSRTKDSMTSLFIAVSLIVIVTPYSIFDMSLWLSAFATLGIIVFSELQNGRVMIHPLINWFISSILSTFFALGATFIFTALKFNGISMLAPLTTLVFSLLIEIFIYVGIAMLAFGWFVPIKIVFIPFGDLLIELASYLSRLDFAYGTTAHVSVKVLTIVFSILFFAFLLLKIKHKKTFIGFLLIMLTSVFALSMVIANNYEIKENVTYSRNGGEQIIITDSGEVALIDVSTHSASTPYNSYSSINKIGLVEIDKYVIVNYSYGLNDALVTLFDTVLVRELLLPTPTNYNEEKLYLKALKTAEEAHVKITRYQSEDFITVGSTSVIPIRNYSLGESKELLFTVLKNEKFYTYLTPTILEGEIKNLASEIIGGSHTVIFGCHEGQGSEHKFNTKIPNVERFIFSSSKMVFGQSVIDYYINKESYFNPEWVEIIR